MMSASIRRATVKQLAYKIKGTGKPASRFAFFLGAGASRQPSIITAGEMIRYFKQQIIEQQATDHIKTDKEREAWPKMQPSPSFHCDAAQCEPAFEGLREYAKFKERVG
jgi:hypothetical protein